MRSFEGKVAVVTGAASGIGVALAARFGREGMKVVLADVHQESLDQAAGELSALGYEALAVRTDVSRAEAVEELARATIERFGRVDILCNNAGVGGAGPDTFWEATLDDWNYVLGVNLWGVINGIRTFVPIMIGQDAEAHVVSTASVGGLVLGSGIYGISKHAVVSLMEGLHIQFLHKYPKLKASVLCPGYIATNLGRTTARNRPAALSDAPLRDPGASGPAAAGRTDTRRYMAPAEVAEITLQGIRDERFYILTHEDFDGLITARLENVLKRRNPDLALARGMRSAQRLGGGRERT